MLFTGTGGWPASIFLTPEQKPFYAGTYFPKESAYGRIGFLDLLHALGKRWKQDREGLLQSAEEITMQLKEEQPAGASKLSWQHLSLQAARWF